MLLSPSAAETERSWTDSCGVLTQLPCFGGVLFLLDNAGGQLTAAGRRHAAAAVARLGAMAPGNAAAEAAIRAACGFLCTSPQV